MTKQAHLLLLVLLKGKEGRNLLVKVVNMQQLTEEKVKGKQVLMELLL